MNESSRSVGRDRNAALGDHPDVDDLVELQEGRFAGEGAERVRRHLASCPQCAREVRDLKTFDVEPAEIEVEARGTEEAEASWARFQKQIALEAAGDKA